MADERTWVSPATAGTSAADAGGTRGVAMPRSRPAPRSAAEMLRVMRDVTTEMLDTHSHVESWPPPGALEREGRTAIGMYRAWTGELFLGSMEAHRADSFLSGAVWRDAAAVGGAGRSPESVWASRFFDRVRGADGSLPRRILVDFGLIRPARLALHETLHGNGHPDHAVMMAATWAAQFSPAGTVCSEGPVTLAEWRLLPAALRRMGLDAVAADRLRDIERRRPLDFARAMEHEDNSDDPYNGMAAAFDSLLWSAALAFGVDENDLFRDVLARGGRLAGLQPVVDASMAHGGWDRRDAAASLAVRDALTAVLERALTPPPRPAVPGSDAQSHRWFDPEVGAVAGHAAVRRQGYELDRIRRRLADGTLTPGWHTSSAETLAADAGCPAARMLWHGLTSGDARHRGAHDVQATALVDAFAEGLAAEAGVPSSELLTRMRGAVGGRDALRAACEALMEARGLREMSHLDYVRRGVPSVWTAAAAPITAAATRLEHGRPGGVGSARWVARAAVADAVAATEMLAREELGKDLPAGIPRHSSVTEAVRLGRGPQYILT